MGESASELDNPSSAGEHKKGEIFSPYLRLILEFNPICINERKSGQAATSFSKSSLHDPALLLKTKFELVGNLFGGCLGPALDCGAAACFTVGLDPG